MITQDTIDHVRDLVVADILAHPAWRAEVERGKMFGILLVDPDTSADPLLHRHGPVSALYAYSGQILGRSDWQGYVPAIYDYLAPDGYFKRHEALITQLNHDIARATADSALIGARQRLQEVEKEGREEVDRYRAFIAAQRATRTTAEAQYQNAELRRIRQRANAAVEAARRDVDDREHAIDAMRHERRQRSDALQRWLFTMHRLCDPTGHERALLDIFAHHATATGSRQTMPPAGTGECCAPRLLHYANRHRLTPLALAEFWYGASPRGEIRHHLHYYEPCQAKCAPILPTLLAGRTVDIIGRHAAITTPTALDIIYEDPWLIAINKPAGMLSVPGRDGGQDDAETMLRRQRPDSPYLKMVHRLDMDTSGILLAALTPEAHAMMQRLFARHDGVQKQYRALVSGPRPITPQTVSLPLAPDFLNRPRQRVDSSKGKEAVTIVRPTGRRVTIEGHEAQELLLTPLTGRTHQLRLHCAHPDGLHSPIVGDTLYGNIRAARMYLHAQSLTFRHPMTGDTIVITCPT